MKHLQPRRKEVDEYTEETARPSVERQASKARQGKGKSSHLRSIVTSSLFTLSLKLSLRAHTGIAELMLVSVM